MAVGYRTNYDPFFHFEKIHSRCEKMFPVNATKAMRWYNAK